MMQDKNEPQLPFPDVSLIRGGPFHRFQEVTRLVGPNKSNPGRRILLAVTICWLVPVVIAALSDRNHVMGLLKSYPVVSRMLIAVPVLLVSLVIMESRFRVVLAHIYKAHLLDAEDLPRMDEILATLVRIRDSFVPELVILLSIAVNTALAYKARIPDDPALSFRVNGELHLTATGWYGVVVSATLFKFLLLLNLWKWLLWTFFTFRFSRLNLKLIATHPDQNGGLGFLGMTPIAFAPIAFATGAVIGSVWRDEILRGGAHLSSFKLPAIVLVAIIAIIALGPLVFFVPKLAILRRRGILEYSIIGQIQSTEFHEKWILNRGANEADLIDAPEISTLCDFGGAYDRIEAMNPFPTDKAALIGLALAVAIPALPTILAEVPLAVILKELFSALR
jgi:hypothetical protein